MRIATPARALLLGPAILLLGAAGAEAASLKLSTPPVAGKPGAVTVREQGVADYGSNFIYVFLTPAASGCAATQEDERNVPQTYLVDQFTLPQGPFNHLSHSGFAAGPRSGLYRLCGYLNSIHGPTADPGSGPPDATATVILRSSSSSHSRGRSHGKKRRRKAKHAG